MEYMECYRPLRQDEKEKLIELMENNWGTKLLKVMIYFWRSLSVFVVIFSEKETIQNLMAGFYWNATVTLIAGFLGVIVTAVLPGCLLKIINGRINSVKSETARVRETELVAAREHLVRTRTNGHTDYRMEYYARIWNIERTRTYEAECHPEVLGLSRGTPLIVLNFEKDDKMKHVRLREYVLPYGFQNMPEIKYV